MDRERCSWCGAPLESDEGYRAGEPAGARCAAFCRLEHVVPWALAGAHWEAGSVDVSPRRGPEQCAACGVPLGEARVVLVRHRGEHRIADAFCRVDHLQNWARAGGRWS